MYKKVFTILTVLLLASNYSQVFASGENWVFGNQNTEYNTPSEDWLPKSQPNNYINNQQVQQIQSSQQTIPYPIKQQITPITNNYQGIKIPAGTAVTVYNSHEINADDFATGQSVNFIVDNAVTVNGIEIIKSGTQATAEITNKRNNFIFGVPGEIQISNFKINNIGMKSLNLQGTFDKKGKSRYWSHFGWIPWVFPLLFVKGEDGIIREGTRYTVYTIGDIYINTENIPVNY